MAKRSETPRCLPDLWVGRGLQIPFVVLVVKSR